MKLQGTRTDTNELVTFDLSDIWTVNASEDTVEVWPQKVIQGRAVVLSSIVAMPAVDPAWVELAEMVIEDDPFRTLPITKRAAELLAEMRTPGADVV